MRIVNRKTVASNLQGTTKTVQNFGQLLGNKPHKLSTVVTLYPHLTISNLTDALKNIYYQPKRGESQFTPIDSMIIEWDIDVNFIKKVEIISYSGGTSNKPGFQKETFDIVLAEKYYDPNDTFTLENKQQLFVVRRPQRLSDRAWKYTVFLVGNDLNRYVDTAYLAKKRVTRLRSNFHAELSERGYTKFTSNTETHRNYLSRHRNSATISGDFALKQNIFIETGKKKKDNLEYFKMDKMEKECLDGFMEARENSNIFGQTNYTQDGKCLDQDAEGRDVPMGDGVIAQIERYCEKFAYSFLDGDILDSVIASMVQKSDQPLGNTYAIVCNERMYTQFGKIMKEDLRFNSPNDGTWYYSKDKGEKIKVGTHVDSYTFQGNTIVFKVDRALSQEYPTHAYGIFLDTGADVKQRPNISCFTLEGAEMLQGSLKGMGGLTGKESGEVATGVHGSEYHLLGYSGCVVFNPYKSFILEESTDVA